MEEISWTVGELCYTLHLLTPKRFPISGKSVTCHGQNSLKALMHQTIFFHKGAFFFHNHFKPYKFQSSKSIFDRTLRESIHTEAHQNI